VPEEDVRAMDDMRGTVWAESTSYVEGNDRIGNMLSLGRFIRHVSTLSSWVAQTYQVQAYGRMFMTPPSILGPSLPVRPRNVSAGC